MTNPESYQDEISLLDIAVVLAENWLMIIMVPIIAGALAFGALTLASPREYISEALLRIDADEAALLKTARVLDEPLRKSGRFVSEERRALLAGQLTVSRQEETGFYAVQLRLDTPEEAQSQLNDIIHSLIARSAPTERQHALLALRREQSETAIAEIEATISRFNQIATRLSQSGQIDSNAALEELGQSIVTLLSNLEARQLALADIEQQLVGSVSEEDILQSPTLAESPEPRGLTAYVLLVIAATGFFAVIVAFAKSGLRSALRTPDGLQKINRIRRAFWLKPRLER